jgi:hypothetical protein
MAAPRFFWESVYVVPDETSPPSSLPTGVVAFEGRLVLDVDDDGVTVPVRLPDGRTKMVPSRAIVGDDDPARLFAAVEAFIARARWLVANPAPTTLVGHPLTATTNVQVGQPLPNNVQVDESSSTMDTVVDNA